MNCWTYNNGKWLNKWPLHDPHIDDTESFFDDEGFSFDVEFPGGSLLIFRGYDDRDGQYVAEIHHGHYDPDFVFLPDFPSYLMFIKEYGEAISFYDLLTKVMPDD